MLIVGGLFVAAANTLGVSKLSELSTLDSVRGRALAQSLMAEVLQQPYHDPGSSNSTSIGPSPTEKAAGNRSLFDDVDDYDGWSSSPPRERDGHPLGGDLGNWTRSVGVAWVDPADLSSAVNHETGAKRVTVTVKHGERTVATLTAVRTSAWFDPADMNGGLTP